MFSLSSCQEQSNLDVAPFSIIEIISQMVNRIGHFHCASLPGPSDLHFDRSHSPLLFGEVNTSVLEMFSIDPSCSRLHWLIVDRDREESICQGKQLRRYHLDGFLHLSDHVDDIPPPAEFTFVDVQRRTIRHHRREFVHVLADE